MGVKYKLGLGAKTKTMNELKRKARNKRKIRRKIRQIRIAEQKLREKKEKEDARNRSESLSEGD